jgi:hypothetical protein
MTYVGKYRSPGVDISQLGSQLYRITVTGSSGSPSETVRNSSTFDRKDQPQCETCKDNSGMLGMMNETQGILLSNEDGQFCQLLAYYCAYILTSHTGARAFSKATAPFDPSVRLRDPGRPGILLKAGLQFSISPLAGRPRFWRNATAFRFRVAMG